MISLIKSGAFDTMEDRKFVMAWYIWETCDKKKRITLQNMNGLINYGLLPEDTEERITARRVYEFNRYLKAVCNKKFEPGYYLLDERCISFLNEIDCEDLMETNNISWLLNIKKWEKVYSKWMDIFRAWIAENKEQILKDLNTKIFQEDWKKYAAGTISAWEMEVMCFYYHEHELAHLNKNKYGFSNFYDLPPDPVVDKTFKKGLATINIFKLHKFRTF